MAVKVVLDIFPDYNFWFCSSVNLHPRKIFSSTVGEPAVGTISRSKKKEVIAHDLVMILASTILKKTIYFNPEANFCCLPNAGKSYQSNCMFVCSSHS